MVILVSLVAAALGREAGIRFAPLPPALFEPPPTSQLLTDRHGRPLRELPVRRPDGTLIYARPPLAPGEIPPLLRTATLAAEDGRFPDHNGVDLRASLRAAASQSGLWGRRSGGSTITQQLLKLAWRERETVGGSPRRGWRHKLVETFGAWRLERTWTKDQILAAYLARLPYGRGNVGSVAAANYFFGKTPAELSPAETALLAALPQAPSRLDPHRHPERARRRQAWVLERMRAAGNLAEDDWQRAVAEAPRLRERGRVFRAGHFVDFVLGAKATRADASRKDAKAQRKEEGREINPEGDGRPAGSARPLPASPLCAFAPLREAATLRTTLDLALHEFIEAELRRQLAALADRDVTGGAAVVLDNRSGEVLALVGSPDYWHPRHGQVNGAWAARSPGSALKPFTYWLAFEAGCSPATVVPDLPAEFPTATGVYRPENYGRRLLGPVRLRTALACSLNLPAVRLLFAHVPGGPAALRTRLRDDLGLTTLRQPAEHYGLGLTLGSGEVRLLELTNAYAALARGGLARPFRLLPVGADEPAPLGRPVGDPRAAFLVADILADTDARAASFGLETPLRWTFPVAVKTGTSTDFRDNWALGFTPEFTVGVWVGNFSGAPMAGVSGVAGAAPLLHAIFERLNESPHGPLTWFPTPAGIAEATVHPVTGKWVAPKTPGGVGERFPVEHPPPPEDLARDYDALGRVRLPLAYAAWLSGGQGGALTGRAVIEPDDRDPLTILSPLSGSLFLLDPDLPGTGQRLALRTRGGSGGPVRWECPTLPTHAEAATGETWADLREGRHVLRVWDKANGQWRETTITVRGL